jgi:hypothetical protein
MKIKAGVMVLALLLLSAVIVSPLSADAAKPNKEGLNVPVSGTVVNNTTGVVAGTVNGTLTITKFKHQNGGINAIGSFAGSITDAAGVVHQVNQAVSLPVQSINGHSLGATSSASTDAVTAASCTILDLVLGPLHLDLLGLVVDLNQVHLTITADQGAGNLLGNLLCAVANLLNGGSPLSNLLNGLTNLLNQILGALG